MQGDNHSRARSNLSELHGAREKTNPPLRFFASRVVTFSDTFSSAHRNRFGITIHLVYGKCALLVREGLRGGSAMTRAAFWSQLLLRQGSTRFTAANGNGFQQPLCRRSGMVHLSLLRQTLPAESRKKNNNLSRRHHNSCKWTGVVRLADMVASIRFRRPCNNNDLDAAVVCCFCGQCAELVGIFGCMQK